MYRCRSDYGVMPLGLNYYGHTIEVLFCKNSVCDVHHFYVTDFSSVLKMFEYLNRNIEALEKESNSILPIQEPLSFASETEVTMTQQTRLLKLETDVLELKSGVAKLSSDVSEIMHSLKKITERLKIG
ncbi:PREDICTED: uncharacterized protein LOC109584037 [Amphimedon queenslandica]|uniref:Uncharacterized protein n=1 Tax=Amphimedon queenslandica TaxID=400682 RepID=A0AAN0JEQ3_AMPQE|nr:PREDICTED: uncharacterized protein LOC109584037 [Amphimedon queenslandica]|eukprot:XP_019855158.1 PREDICTED: uncharacterized protein LOC109584037 [Amphimedon queenslandica]